MNYLKELQGMSAAEVRDFLKVNFANDAFHDAIVNNLEEMTSTLLKNKAFRDELLSCYLSLSDYQLLSEALITNGYTPSPKVIDNILEFGAAASGLLTELLSKFPSFPITNTFVLKVFNSGLELLGCSLIKSKKELHTTKFFQLVIECNMLDQDFEEWVKDDPIIVEMIMKRFERDLVKISDAFINHVINAFPNIAFSAEKVCKRKLTADSYRKVFLMKATTHYYGRSDVATRMGQIEWNEEIEKIASGDFLKIDVLNPPKTSAFWSYFISRHPEALATEDLLAHINKNGGNTVGWKQRVYEEIIRKRGLEAVSKLDLDILELNASPSVLRDMIGSDSKIAKYLYDNMNPKYRAQLRKKVDDDDLVTRTIKNKKSYFSEVLSAISRSNVEAFRECLSHGYDLDKFVTDTHQTSKRKSAESTSVKFEFLYKLTKEELMKLKGTCLRFFSYWYNEDDNADGFPYKFTTEEVKVLVHKIDYRMLLRYAENKLEVFEILDGHSLERLISSDIPKYIKEDPEMLNAFLEVLKRRRNFLDCNAMENLTKVFTKKQLEGLKLTTSSYGDSTLITLKCTDGEYLLDEQEVLVHMLKTHLKEDESALAILRTRSIEALKKLCKAYLDGNPGMTALAGFEISHKRMKVKYYENLSKELEVSVSGICDKLFEEGAPLDVFKKSLVNWKKSLVECDRDVTIKVKIINDEDLEFLGLTKLFKLESKSLRIGVGSTFSGNVAKLLNRIKFDELIIDQRAYGVDSTVASIMGLGKHIDLKNYDIKNDKPEPQNSVRLALLRKGVRVANTDEIERHIIENFSSIGNNFSGVGDMELLSKMGLIFNDENVYKILESNHLGPEVVEWMASRLGDLKGFSFDRNVFRSNSRVYKSLEDFGAVVLGHDNFRFLRVQQVLAGQGKEFEPISVERWDRTHKGELIKFIEKNIDPDFSKLNLLASNLDALNLISPYKALRDSVLVDDSDVIRVFMVPATLVSNKKLLNSIKEYAALHTEVIYKASLMKQVFGLLNPDAEIILSDFLDYSNHAKVTESESLQKIPMFSMKLIISNADLITSQDFILSNMDKTSIVRFLRSASDKDENYLRDIFDMIHRVLKGVEALEARKAGMIDDGGDTERVAEITNSIEGVLKRLAEVAAMDNVVHMHDRLVPLLVFIKADPIQPLNQDKFKSLEKDDKISAKMGVKLYFPKTRGDLQELGNTHGWCVNYSSSYGDNVISKGNVLVALVPADKEIDMGNVVALAHYINKGNNEFYLEQLKWSKLQKKGSTNVDATKDFDHQNILSVIKDHLAKVTKKAA